MMKHVVVLAGLVVLAVAQRPFYAGSRGRSYPEVLPQNRPPGTNDVDPMSTGLNQRIGENSAVTLPPNYEPYDPFNDQQLIDQIKTWPREKQPFWYLNREAIAAQLRSRTVQQSQSGSMTPPRASFAGSL